MSPEKIAEKIRLIGMLSAEGLKVRSWAMQADGYTPFPGEIAALTARAKALGCAVDGSPIIKQ